MNNVLLITLLAVTLPVLADANADFYEALGAIGNAPKRAFEIGNSLDQQGDCRGNYILAQLYQSGDLLKGNPVKEDIGKARELFLKSAAAGCGNSAALVARFYGSAGGGIGLPRDLNKAIYWHSKAFEANNKIHCESAAIVAEIYNQSQNYVEAYKWYLKAVNSDAVFCGDKERLMKLKELEAKQKNQVEAMREDPPVAGVKLSLSGESKSLIKPKKKSKKKN